LLLHRIDEGDSVNNVNNENAIQSQTEIAMLSMTALHSSALLNMETYQNSKSDVDKDEQDLVPGTNRIFT
jgi:hypothetical protein